MRDFNEFLIAQDGQLFNEIFGFGKPDWHKYLAQLGQTPDGPIAQKMLKMFSKGVDQNDYTWIKQNLNSVWSFFQKHRNNLEGMGVNVDGLIKKFGLYDPKEYKASGSRYTNDFERNGADARQSV